MRIRAILNIDLKVNKAADTLATNVEALCSWGISQVGIKLGYTLSPSSKQGCKNYINNILPIGRMLFM